MDFDQDFQVQTAAPFRKMKHSKVVKVLITYCRTIIFIADRIRDSDEYPSVKGHTYLIVFTRFHSFLLVFTRSMDFHSFSLVFTRFSLVFTFFNGFQ